MRQLVQLAAAQGVEAFAEYCARRSRHPLGALVSHLFEQLDDAPQTAAKYASVVGRYFDADTLLHVLGAAEGDGMEAAGLRAALEVLELRSFVRAVDASTYQFQHPSIQETLYRQWLPRKAAAVHNAVAEHIEAAQRDRSEDRRREMYPLLSHHYELSACHPELAFRYSVKAADYFISTQAYADGLRYAVKAAGMVDSGSYSAADCRVLLDVVLTALDDLRSSARLPLGRLLPPEERAAAPHRGVGGRLGGGGPRGAALHQRVRVGRALPRPGRAQRVWRGRSQPQAQHRGPAAQLGALPRGAGLAGLLRGGAQAVVCPQQQLVRPPPGQRRARPGRGVASTRRRCGTTRSHSNASNY